MANEQKLLNDVRNHIQNMFRSSLSSEDFVSSNDDTITMISGRNTPEEGSIAHATLGVCLYHKPSLKPGEDVAVEFIGVEHESSDIVRGILSSCAYGVMDGMPASPFTCWGDMLPIYIPESKLKHVLFLPPYLWGEELLVSTFENITVFYLLVCPLSDGETNFLLKFHDNSIGAKTLIQEVEKAEKNIFDFNRDPIF